MYGIDTGQWGLYWLEMMAKFLRILGMSLTVIFSLGAIIGAMITMYSVTVQVPELHICFLNPF
jgi:hypothetical protein